MNVADIASSEDERLVMAKSLVQHLEHGEAAKADKIIEDLASVHESSLFQEIGKLTRELHDALGACRDDKRIASIAEQEMPNARERLDFVIKKTEESAHKTLNAIDESLPLSEHLKQSACEMYQEWDRFTRREMQANEFRALSKKISRFLADVSNDASTIHRSLSDIMMAQDFQDITGQIIKQVIELVQDLESSLVKVITKGREEADHNQTTGHTQNIHAEGPQVNKENDPDVMSAQDEVDALLSSLGF